MYNCIYCNKQVNSLKELENHTNESNCIKFDSLINKYLINFIKYLNENEWF
jgi:hypothetical protein